MRRLLLASVALAALAGSALAADLPSSKSAPVYTPEPLPVFSWTGFYLGVEGGGDFRQYKDSFGGYTIDKDAGLVGGVIGYNWQVNNFVLGLEGDAAAVLGGNKAFTPNGTPIYNNTFNSDYAAAIRGRVGVAFDRALIYAAGGVAFGDAKVGYSGLPLSASYTTSRTGYTIGGGLDYAFSPNWIGRIEYRYVDLGKGGNYNYGRYANDGISVDSSQVMLALIYKFGAPAPAPTVAKY
jgi:outer membrane immunogenic protein